MRGETHATISTNIRSEGFTLPNSFRRASGKTLNSEERFARRIEILGNLGILQSLADLDIQLVNVTGEVHGLVDFDTEDSVDVVNLFRFELEEFLLIRELFQMAIAHISDQQGLFDLTEASVQQFDLTVDI